MRRTTLAVVISSVLLGAVAAQAEPTMDPTQTSPAQTTAPTDPREQAGSSTSQDTSPGANNNESVGAPESNVDEKSTSGSYYPNSAGTVGDTPTQPTSTSPEPNNGDQDPGLTNQWTKGDADGDGYLSKDELAKISPTIVTRFDEMDVDSNGKLTRGEFRTWHESHKARMDADQPATSRSDGSRVSEGSNASGNSWSSTPGRTTMPNSSTMPNRSTMPDSSTTPNSSTMPNRSTMPDSSTTPNSSSMPDSSTMPDRSTVPDDKGN